MASESAGGAETSSSCGIGGVEMEAVGVVEDTLEELLEVVFSRCAGLVGFDASEESSVDDAVDACLGGVGVTLMQRQEWAVERASLALQNWTTCGSEPKCTPVDTWARGVVPITYRKPEEKKARPIDRVRRLSAGLSGLGLFAKYDKSYSLDSKIRRASAMSTLPNSAVGSIKPLSQRHLPSLRTSGSKSQSLFVGSAARAGTIAAKLTEEEEREQRLREEIELRKQAEYARQRQAEKDHEELVRLELLQKDLRGKEYSYDHNGNVVVLSPLNPEKLPRPAVVPRISVAPAQSVAGAAEASSGGATTARERGGSEKGSGAPGVRRNLLAGADGVDFIELQVDLQPSLTEHIKVSDGVVFREAGMVKAGGVIRPSGNSMTRREYVNMVEELGAVAPVTSKKADAAAGTHRSEARQAAAAAEARRNAAAVALTPQRKKKESQQLPAWVTDARTIEDTVVSEELKDENLELISSPDWGQNSSVRASQHRPARRPPRDASSSPRSSLRARKEAAGAMPRDRPGKLASINKHMRSIDRTPAY